MTEDEKQINDIDPCLDDPILRSYAEGKIADERVTSFIESHLEFCSACKGKVEASRSDTMSHEEKIKAKAEHFKNRVEELKRNQARGTVPGSIWRTIPPTDEIAYGPLVVILAEQQTRDGTLLKVAEVSEDIAQAIETDMLLDPESSGLSFRCMVRGGNVFTMSPRWVSRFVGILPSLLARSVIAFCESAEHFDDNVPLTQYEFGHDADGNRLMKRRGVVSGMLVTRDDDPRLPALSEGKRQCEYLVESEPEFSATEKDRDAARIGVVKELPKRRSIVRLVGAVAAMIAIVVLTWQFSKMDTRRRMEQLAAQQKEKIAGIEKRLAQAAKQQKTLEDKLSSQKDFNSRLKKRLAQLDSTPSDRESMLAEMEKETQTLKNRLAAIERQSSQLRGQIARMDSTLFDKEKLLAEAKKESQSLRQRLASLEQQSSRLRDTIAQLDSEKAQTEMDKREAVREANELRKTVAALKGQTTEPDKKLAEEKNRKNGRFRIAKAGEPAAQKPYEARREALVPRREEEEEGLPGEFPAVEAIGVTEILKDAAASGDLARLKELLRNKQYANERDHFSGTIPLHRAAENGQLKAVELLLDHGARINAVDFQGRTPLILAAQKGHKPVVSLLLKRGADPKLKAKNGKTAADWAAFFGHDDVAKLLRSRE